MPNKQANMQGIFYLGILRSLEKYETIFVSRIFQALFIFLKCKIKNKKK